MFYFPFTLLSDNHLWCNSTKAIVDVCPLKASCRVINEPTIYDRRCSSDSQTLLSLLIIQQSCTYHFNLRNNLKVFILFDFTFILYLIWCKSTIMGKQRPSLMFVKWKQVDPTIYDHCSSDAQTLLSLI